MGIFNLGKKRREKIASKTGLSELKINEKKIQEKREEFGLSNEQQGVVGKNINLSLNKKEKDALVPFNSQLEANRKNEENVRITEAYLNEKQTSSKDKRESITSINKKTQKYDTEKRKAFNKAERKIDKDTKFWDEYVGVQLEQKNMPTKINGNIPSQASQLANNPDRFKGDSVKSLKSAKEQEVLLKTADAMLFHIFAEAEKQGRELSFDEVTTVASIEKSKMHILENKKKIAFNRGIDRATEISETGRNGLTNYERDLVQRGDVGGVGDNMGGRSRGKDFPEESLPLKERRGFESDIPGEPVLMDEHPTPGSGDNKDTFVSSGESNGGDNYADDDRLSMNTKKKDNSDVGAFNMHNVYQQVGKKSKLRGNLNLN